ncbi:MAG: hypothetical protein Rubg2KO_04680 [Rubricoccaceae bacterium]
MTARLLTLFLVSLLISTASAQSALTLPARINGQLTKSSEQVPLTRAGDIRPADRYTFSLSVGQTATVRMESTAFDTYLKVLLNGQVFQRNDDYEGSRNISQLTLTAPGSYTVLAGAFSGASNTGAYTLSVSASSGDSPSASSRALTLPATVRGQLALSSVHVPLTLSNDVRPADAYTFTLRTGQRATVRMESSAFDTYLKVLRNGTFHARNDDHEGSREVSQVTLSSPGEYTVLAGAFSSIANTGPYELAVHLEGTSTLAKPTSGKPSSQSSSRRDGGTHSGILTNDDDEIPLLIAGNTRKVDAFTVELRAGEDLVVTMESNAFDTYLAVAISGEIVARNDDDGSTQRSHLRYTAPSDGQVYIYAGTFSEDGRGSYTFTWHVE